MKNRSKSKIWGRAARNWRFQTGICPALRTHFGLDCFLYL